MNEFFLNSAYFGVVLSLVTYFFGTYIRKKINFPLFNPLLIAIILTAAVLLVFKIDYTAYNASAKYISYLLTPATVSLAIASSSFVGITYTVTLELSVEILISSPFLSFAESSISIPR